MDKGLIGSKIVLLLMMCFCFNAYGQIFKIVDKDGNVTYTDQPPGDGTEPMELPELSVVSTDYEAPTVATDPVPETEEDVTTPAALRKLYRDFRISRPSPEETFWGTENAVVVAWEASAPLQEGMTVRFTIDGKAQASSAENMKGVSLDRGSHTVSAVLLDSFGKSVMTTDTVTFYVHQQSVRSNGP